MSKLSLKNLPVAERGSHLVRLGKVDSLWFWKRMSAFLVPFASICYFFGRMSAPVTDSLDQRFYANTEAPQVQTQSEEDSNIRKVAQLQEKDPALSKSSPVKAALAKPLRGQAISQAFTVNTVANTGNLSQNCIELTQNADSTENLLGAIDSSEANCLSAALEKGGNLQHIDDNGSTLIHHAIESGSPEILQALISKGVNLNAQNHDGVTALQMAVEQGQVDSVKKILDASADLNLKNADGETPLDIAKNIAEGGQDEQANAIVQALINKGAKEGKPLVANSTEIPIQENPIENGPSVAEPNLPQAEDIVAEPST